MSQVNLILFKHNLFSNTTKCNLRHNTQSQPLGKCHQATPPNLYWTIYGLYMKKNLS